ncbi:hypothetical protein V5O48_017024 [Marasmius crinis-equi]|uniref:Peptidase A2 domain-containing protein n=1 Tax=Marasmius crinis-equi TaxID=585013 RepID=A0ABR3EQ50_9AGAR
MNDAKCPKKQEKVHFARIMEDDEPDDETTFLISSGDDTDPETAQENVEQEGDAYAAALYDNEYEPDDLYALEGYSYEQTYLAHEEQCCDRATTRLATLLEEPYDIYDYSELPHEEGFMDYGEYMAGIQEIPGEEGLFRATVEPKWSQVKRMGTRPHREFAENRCLATWININNMKCFALFDTGSTADILSPDFATMANTDIFQLRNPVILQLGTKGSRSRINYGCEAEFHLGDEQNNASGRNYFDVANIDRYDMVVGCAFM